MTYAYLFKYIIIGDTGNPRATVLKLGRGCETPKSGLGGGAHLVGWAIK